MFLCNNEPIASNKVALKTPKDYKFTYQLKNQTQINNIYKDHTTTYHLPMILFV